MLNVAEGRPHRTKILARLGSYHGATLATISAGGDQRRHRAIGIRMPGFVDLSQPREGFDALGELRQVITDEGPETIAAMIAEPIAYQAGMIVPPDEYWPGVADLCRQHGIALIVDEVLTGFGRTGRMFACEHWGLQPDVLTMSKGLTSGYAPLGAVGLSTEMRMRLESALDGGEGVLGFTSTGHPLSCRVALANLAVIGDERLVERSMRMGQHLRGQLDRLRARESRIAEYRVMGLLAAVDLWIGSEERSQALCQMVVREMAGQGVLARPFGRAVALAPPLVISDEELNFMVDALAAAVAKAAAIFDN